VRRLLTSLRALLASPERLSAEIRGVKRTLAEVERAAQQSAKRDESESQALRAELAALRDEVHERLLQYHLQLGRLSALIDGEKRSVPLGGRRPLHVSPVAREVEPAPTDKRARPGTSNEWLELAACPACKTPERTVVCEWNKLILLDTAPDEQAWRYDYAVCHGCGILYATRRPIGARYRYLLDNFEDVIDKDAGNPLLNPHPLTDADRDRYRRLIARGVFVSDHDGGPHLRGVLSDRLENSAHVELLGSLLAPRGARVLEVRPRAGTILEGLRRHYGADVYAMPIFESQQFIMQELYGIQTSNLIDFDCFRIPFDDPFDLIVCNHMFNHAVRVDGFLATLRNALRPGGHVYFYNEIDDSEFLAGGQSMIATMNPLHLQAADTASLARAIGAAGFEPVFVKGHKRRNLCLMRRVDGAEWPRIPAEALAERVAAYQRARDRAVLRAPERVRERFADVWPDTIERAMSAGLAGFDEAGALRLVKDGR
jgi:SAM-dependent methyltransferase